MYEWVKPKIAVPAHGEAAHLTAHAELARSLGVPEVVSIRNGKMIRLAPGPAEVIDEVPVGRIYKDGNLIGSIEEMGIGERRRVALVGHVTVLIELTNKLELRNDPDVVCLGLPKFDKSGEDLEELLIDAVAEAIGSIPRGRRKDLELVRESARRATRSAAYSHWGKKPIVTVFVTQS